jgi:hypothetical protein
MRFPRRSGIGMIRIKGDIFIYLFIIINKNIILLIMNIEEQQIILEIINQKEIIKSFLLKDAENREEFKKGLKKEFKNIDLEKIIDELIDLYNSLLKIARFKNTRAQSLEDFDRIMDNITKFINSGGRYNKGFLNMIIIGLKAQYNEISKLLSVKNNKDVIDLFRRNYLNEFDKIPSKEEKIKRLKEISEDISEEIGKEISEDIDENEVFEILKNFFKHQTQFYNISNLKIFSILLNSKTIAKSIYNRFSLFERLNLLSFEELKTNEDFIKIVKEVKKELIIDGIEIDKNIIEDDDINFICYLMIKKVLNSGIGEEMYDFFVGGNINKKLIKEIQSFLKKYKNRNNDKLINVLKQLKKI